MNRRNLIKSGLASAAIIQFPGIAQMSFAEEGGIPSITFTVDDVKPATTALPLRPSKEAIESIIGVSDRSLESWTRDTPELVAIWGETPVFLAAITTAYDRHYPIILSPDMIWLQILQGLAAHVNANAEKLRHHFVSHEGKVLIEIERDEFRRGNPDNDWEGAFAEFSQKMRPHIGETNHSLIAGKFGTTGPVEQAAMNVSLMDAMQSYFVFAATTSCGFPSVTLEGSQDDWRALRDRAQKLATFDLTWWTKHLIPILDQFVETSAGRPDKDFWCNFYKLQSVGSGTASIHGHINTFFPYLGKNSPTKARLLADFEIYIRNTKSYGPRTEAQIKDEIRRFAATVKEDELEAAGNLRRNPFMGRTDLKRREGMTTSDVSAKMNSAPMIWNYFGEMLQMELLAGFIGATQDPITLAIRPKIGWAVREATG